MTSPDKALPIASDTIPTPATDQESRTVHRCEAFTPDGVACRYWVATVFVEGRWLCHHHRPKDAPEPEAPGMAPARPPVKALRKPADALALASWAALEMAAGHISPQRCAPTVAACKEYRIAWA